MAKQEYGFCRFGLGLFCFWRPRPKARLEHIPECPLAVNPDPASKSLGMSCGQRNTGINGGLII
jgi:hypothetical protein